MSLIRLVLLAALCPLASCSSTPQNSESNYRGPRAVIINGEAIAPNSVPAPVKRAIAAANDINHLPYQFGGGHGRECFGYDCSGTVSYVLRNAGLLDGSTTSTAFRNYGSSGPGKYITLYARDGHVFMTLCGIRFDTTSGGSGHVGPRWMANPRNTKGFKMRHPTGL
jgi:hypothetical protein